MNILQKKYIMYKIKKNNYDFLTITSGKNKVVVIKNKVYKIY